MRLVLLGVLAAGGFGVVAAASAGQSQDAANGAAATRQETGDRDSPMPVLSDTLEYCVTLETRVRKQRNRPAEVEEMLREGHLLCDHGQVREGIAQLRRALVMMKRGGLRLLIP